MNSRGRSGRRGPCRWCRAPRRPSGGGRRAAASSNRSSRRPATGREAPAASRRPARPMASKRRMLVSGWRRRRQNKTRFAPCRQMNPLGPGGPRSSGSRRVAWILLLGCSQPLPSAPRLPGGGGGAGRFVSSSSPATSRSTPSSSRRPSPPPTRASSPRRAGALDRARRRAPLERADPPGGCGPAQDLLSTEGLPRGAGRHHGDPHRSKTPRSPFTSSKGSRCWCGRSRSGGSTRLEHRDRLVRDLALVVGEPYDRDLLLVSADTLITRLQDRGYPEARVLIEKADVNREARTADISLLVEPGKALGHRRDPRRGTEHDRLGLRALRCSPPSRAGRSTAATWSRASASSIAPSSSASPRSSWTPPISSRGRDGAAHHPGAGRPHAPGAGGGGLRHQRLFPAGRSGGPRATRWAGARSSTSRPRCRSSGWAGPPGRRRCENSICSALKDDSIGSTEMNYNLTTSFRRPVFISPANAVALSLFAERRSEFAVYRREELGGASRCSGRPSRGPRSRSPSGSRTVHRGQHGSFCAFFNACTETDIAQLRERRLIATLARCCQRTRVNNPLDPTRGLALTAEVTHSSRLIGSSEFAQFTRVIGDAAVLRPLGSRCWRCTSGPARWWPRSYPRGGSEGNFVPPEQRFYAGGPNDVRGFNRNELGPLVYVVLRIAARYHLRDPGRSGGFGAECGHRRQLTDRRQRRAPDPVSLHGRQTPAGPLCRRGNGLAARRRRPGWSPACASPGFGLPVPDRARAGPARCGLQSPPAPGQPAVPDPSQR